jgi:Holliday junction resolvasome RuvABC endonuclease subunit
MTRCLAIDQATISGYAFGIFGKKPISGTIKLPSAWRPVKAAILEGNVRDLIQANQVEMIVMEDIYAQPSKKFNMEIAKWMHSARAAIESAAYKSGLGERNFLAVNAGKWRKAFGIAGTGKRSDLKAAAFRKCLDLGWEPRNQDEADALGLWAYAESLYEPAFGLTTTSLFQTVRL